MTYTKFNLNDSIKVKIKEKGYQFLVNEHKRLFIDYPKVKPLKLSYLKSIEDSEGYTEMQMHAFLDHFSGLGFCLPDYIDINILVSVKETP